MEIIITGLVLVLIFFIIMMATVIVPQSKNYIVERLGKFNGQLDAGLHFIIPFIDNIRAKIDLREVAIDVPSQVCITKDNTQVTVDGVVYIQVIDSRAAIYQTNNYLNSIITLAQTTLRSIIGTMNLDETLQEREAINVKIVNALDEATNSWGVKLLRYEIKDLLPPEAILRAMQDQITAEREKRAKVIRSEGEKIEAINLAEGQKEADIRKSEGEAQAIINASNAEKEAKINAAKGEAESIKLVAEAKQNAIKIVAESINNNGGIEAVNFRLAEQYISEYGKIVEGSNTVIVPNNLSDVTGMITGAMSTLNAIKKD